MRPPVAERCNFFYGSVAECIRTAFRPQRLRDCEFKSHRSYHLYECGGTVYKLPREGNVFGLASSNLATRTNLCGRKPNGIGQKL